MTADLEVLLRKPGITPEEASEAGLFPLSRNGLYRALARATSSRSASERN